MYRSNRNCVPFKRNCRSVYPDLANKISYELIIVNDGSSDSTWNIICSEAAENQRIHGISFSRNFGKESAIIAGLSAAKGECAVVIDCDLQHPPDKIAEMYHLWEQGYQIVEGTKTDRGKESGFHRFAAKMFYKMISDATNIDMSHASDFKLLDRSAVNVLINMPERNAFSCFIIMGGLSFHTGEI